MTAQTPAPNDDAPDESEAALTTDSDSGLDTDETSSKWRLFETMVAAAEAELDASTDVTHNEFIPGLISRTQRQIDILARKSVVRAEVLVVIECKRYKRKLGIGKVDEFVGKLLDVGASHGILYGYSGVTAPARSRAANALNPSVEIRDFEVTETALDAARPPKSSNHITYEELLEEIALEYGEQLARTVEEHLSFNCDAGTGCHGVVEIDGYDDEIPRGACSDCGTVHYVCECDGQVVPIFDQTRDEQACWCGAQYELLLDRDAELRDLRLTEHGAGCDQVHSRT